MGVWGADEQPWGLGPVTGSMAVQGPALGDIESGHPGHRPSSPALLLYAFIPLSIFRSATIKPVRYRQNVVEPIHSQ